jgi:preprotein translocase subunit SecD
MAPEESGLGNYLRKALFVGGTALCLFALLAGIRVWAGRKTYRVVYHLGVPGSKVTEADLHRTVAVLAARLKALRGEFKVSRCNVQALPPDRIEVQLRCGGEPADPLAWLAMPGRAELHLLHPRDDILDRPGSGKLPPDYEVKTYREKRYVLGRGGELKTVESRYAVQREPALTVGGFSAVTIETVGMQKRVILTFTFAERDAHAFASLTALHAGRKLAMLIDGEMLFPPKQIESSVTAGRVQVQGFFYIPPLRRLAEMLNAGSLPLPLQELSRTVGCAAPASGPTAQDRTGPAPVIAQGYG